MDSKIKIKANNIQNEKLKSTETTEPATSCDSQLFQVIRKIKFRNIKIGLFVI